MAEVLRTESDQDVHTFFGLSYANFLVLPRSLLQSMPLEWQERFTAMVEEAWRTIDCPTPPGGWRVLALDERGRYLRNPVPHYNRGHTVLPARSSDA